MSKHQGQIATWSQYLALRAVMALACLAGLRLSLIVAAGLGRLYFCIDRRHRRRAINNLRLAFPEWDDNRLAEIARRSCEHFAQLAVEIIFLPRKIRADNYEKHLVRKDELSALDLFRARQPLMMVSGHFGNWEAVGHFFSVEGHAIGGVFRRLDNRLINEWFLRSRRRSGLNMIEKRNRADLQIAHALKNREAVGFIADQNGGDRGVFVPCFGRLASATKTVGLLAMTMRVPVLVGYGRRIEPYRLTYEIAVVDVIRPCDWEGRPDPMYYVTARYVRALEQIARQHPQAYLWMHRRFKSRPRFEREGKPMPEAFKDKLRELPWVDEAMIEELQKPLGFDSHA